MTADAISDDPEENMFTSKHGDKYYFPNRKRKSVTHNITAYNSAKNSIYPEYVFFVRRS